MGGVPTKWAPLRNLQFAGADCRKGLEQLGKTRSGKIEKKERKGGKKEIQLERKKR